MTWSRAQPRPARYRRRITAVSSHAIARYITDENTASKVIAVICEYTVDKEGLVKAKITDLGGKEEAKKNVKEMLPVGTKFSFQWKVTDDAAKLADLKGDEVEPLKALAAQLLALKQSGPDALPAYVRTVRLKLFSEARRAILEVPHG